MATGFLFTRCPSCQAKNRLPVARAAQVGRCGKCGGELPANQFFGEGVVEVTEVKFDSVTRLSPQPVLVDFSASWCAPCHQLAPVLEQYAGEQIGRLLVVKVDTEQAPTTATRFAVQSVPTLVLLRSGLEVGRISGALGLPALRQWVARYLD